MSLRAAYWEEGRYGVMQFHCAGFRGYVCWTSGGYEAAFAGKKSESKFREMQEAKAAVEEIARKKAQEVLNALQFMKELNDEGTRV